MIPGTQEAATNGIIEKYCYSNIAANCSTYGGLYQWDEAMQYSTTPGAQGICPAGWHLPTYAEWTTLTTYLNGEPVAGGKLKESGILHWQTPNTAATNETGFTALPAAGRGAYGAFGVNGTDAGFWTSTPYYDTTSAWERYLTFSNSMAHPQYLGKVNGISIRCLKNP